MTSEKSNRKDKNQNIQVFVRLRPLNQREKDIKSLGVVDVVNNREVVVRQSQQTSHTKKFTFDRAFGPNAKQVEVYQDVVSPLIKEVLAGYNCTVFAYGQTGTGKTHTMIGEYTDETTTWQSDPLSGIIPRALSQLFDELRLNNTECTVRVSYLELYNEELFDLLSTSEDNSKLRIYEDVTRKGSNIVNGLEEITVYNKSEVYKIMAQGQERKRVASTLMNAQSSRSHTVFTIVVHMKENTNSTEGEELVKVGKLNLVDLAGSENISKAGSDNPAKKERARECVNINQSLLTLGRVITALVERHPHIPYRESKLTRILQESLGGRTKTSIIATISPGHKDLEETMSTLEYAHRAKNIQNKPEINQKMTKVAILKEFAEEIDRLKRDLQAARDKNGVYLASETFAELTVKQEEQKKEIQELLLHKRAMEEERDKMSSLFSKLSNQLVAKEAKLHETTRRLDETKGALVNTSRMLKTTKLHFEEQRHLVEKQRETEEALSGQAKQLMGAAEQAVTHVATLHDTVERRRNVEAINLQVTRTFREQSEEQRNNIRNGVESFSEQLNAALKGLFVAGESHSAQSVQGLQHSRSQVDDLLQAIAQAFNEMKSLTERAHEDFQTQTSTKRDQLFLSIRKHSDSVDALLQEHCRAMATAMETAKAAEGNGRDNMDKFVKQWYTSGSARVAALRSAQCALEAAYRNAEAKRLKLRERRNNARRDAKQIRERRMQDAMQEISVERSLIEQRLTKQLTDLELEKRETEDRLAQWVEEERKMFEERIQRHVAQQREIAEERARRKTLEVEEERRLLKERMDRRVALQREQLQLAQEECASDEMAEQEEGSVANEAAAPFKKFYKIFDDETTAITSDMEAFSRSVVEIVEHINRQMMSSLESAKQQAENGTQDLVSADVAAAQQFANDAAGILNEIVSGSKATMDKFIEGVEARTSATEQTLSSLSTTANTLLTLESDHQKSQASDLQQLGQYSQQFRDELINEVTRHAELEAKYLMQEYTVYTPSGSTPLRQEYRFPRSLTATSPHERILARFRAMRSTSVEDDCVVIESDTEVTRSDSDSSISEDSAVFAAPSPPEPKPVRAARPEPQPIVKCTSESDIYIIRKHQGKENLDRPNSTKKPSRLRAPNSLKKPLAPRNQSTS